MTRSIYKQTKSLTGLDKCNPDYAQVLTQVTPVIKSSHFQFNHHFEQGITGIEPKHAHFGLGCV